jgi:two-component system response regulator CpxR
MHKLLIIDDDLALTSLLTDYFSAQQFDVEVANSPDQGLIKLKDGDYDLLLLDVMMPVMDGFEALKQLRHFSNIPVIMLTARGDDYDKILGLELGADDYLAKPFNHRELLARVKALIRRLDTTKGLQQEHNISIHGIEVMPATHSALVLKHPLELTGTEFLMLAALMKHAGQLLSKEKLSEQVLGRKLAAFDRSLDMHVSNIRKKLAQHGVQDVIKTVRGNGYMMIADAS